MSFLLSLLVWLFSVNQTQLHCLTEAVYYEAGNQSVIGKLSVANVIRNRVIDGRWPDGFCRVVRERGQFSYYWDGLPEPLPKNNSKLERVALAESEWVSLLTMIIPVDITGGSLYYHNDKIDPPHWTKSVTMNIQIDNHIFYTD